MSQSNFYTDDMISDTGINRDLVSPILSHHGKLPSLDPTARRV